LKRLLGREIDSHGTKISVYEGTKKSGEVILFLHPQGSTAEIWQSALDFFNENYHVVLMDLRGHGRSGKPALGYDIHSQCVDILSVMDHLKIKRAHLVGNSLGGDIATAFAALYPDRVLSLTNIDSGMINYVGENGERDITKEQVIEEFKAREIKGFLSRDELNRYVRKVFPSAIWDGYFEHWFKYVSIFELEDGRISYQIPISINTQIMEMVCDLNYLELYKTITCPILFLPAEQEDKLSIKLQYIKEASKYTYTKTTVIPGSKHLMVLDQGQETFIELAEFLIENKVAPI
jgi:pimeloyl-ACP methyl ester carboxylesterase